METTAKYLTILVVDNDEMYSLALKTLIYQELEIKVVVASTVKEVLDIIKREHPCMILLDLQILDDSEQSVIFQLRENENSAKIPILAYSSTINSDLIKRLHIPKIANAYLPKPAKPQEIIDCIVKILT